MPPRRSIGFFIVLGVVIAVSAFSLARQRNETDVLRSELESARREANALARLQAENRRLRERQIPAAELDALRADHAALPRLRAELDALKQQTPAPSR